MFLIVILDTSKLLIPCPKFVIVPLRMVVGYVPVPPVIETPVLESVTSLVIVNPFKSATTGPPIGRLMLIAPRLDPEV